MKFCPPNETFADVWVDHGVNPCFMETVTTSTVFTFIIVFGTIQLIIYRKYALPVPAAGSAPSNKLYALQVTLLFLFPLLTLLRFILQATTLHERVIYGYMVLYCLQILIMYPYSYLLLTRERNMQLPSVPAKGHGLVLLVFWTLAFMIENLAFINLRQQEWWFNLNTPSDSIEMGLFVARYLMCLVIFVLGLKAPGILTTRDYLDLQGSTANLVSEGAAGTAIGSSQGSTWRNIWQKTRILAPFLWPKKDVLLQLNAAFCFLLLGAGRVINLYVPIYSKNLVDSMTIEPLSFRWDYVLIYVAFKFLQGGGTGNMGVLNNLRSFLWIKIQQYTSREVEVNVFRHIHSLSLRWHLSRKTGEVIRIMDRGTDSINNLLNYILFSIAPCIVDILIAVIYFVTYFNFYFGLIVFLTMALYLTATIMVTEWRTKYQRSMNLADNAAKAKCTDSLLNYETVKYYCAEDYEVQSYQKALINYQKEEWKSIITLNILNTAQNVIISGGLLAGSLLCVHMVVDRQGLTVGDYVLFSSYIIQLYVPLNWFGTYYRMIQKNFVDMENMFELMRENRDVDDVPDARDLQVTSATVEFNNVTFGYLPERVILRNISFQVPAGKTLALVGPSGSGKTTVMRLLFRFYDIDSGTILIDGQNVKFLKQKSVRRAIGVVPQDTVLFNETIKYNIKYGELTADDAGVIEAARSADIHSKIITFPQGYDTVVGERGLKLSGGEKQRVAIARTVLKNPPVVLLDEATSALDTETERNIQASMNRLWSHRTTIIVAHRLSTIIHADEICVLKDGEIVERGRHDALIASKGVYAKMWEDQLKNPQPEDGARQAGEGPDGPPKSVAGPPIPPHHHPHF